MEPKILNGLKTTKGSEEQWSVLTTSERERMDNREKLGWNYQTGKVIQIQFFYCERSNSTVYISIAKKTLQRTYSMTKPKTKPEDQTPNT